ncbi:hypothetical protein K1719_003907 [Acacia pycnantha]|nr:hypothetical protein K1719_003907 [Acacia pycnantha]
MMSALFSLVAATSVFPVFDSSCGSSGLKKMFWNIFGGLRHISQVANSMRRLMLTKALSLSKRLKGEGLKASGVHYQRKYGITL